MAEKKAGPDTTSPAYDLMAPRWEVIDTLLGGTEAMRAAGTTYLPQHPEESDKRYQERLESNVLLNMTEITLDQLTGKPFSEPMKLSDDVPQRIQDDILPDVDLQGNNLDVFCNRWFKDGFAKAYSHVLVEFPRVERQDGQTRTLADDRTERLRPYWVHVPPENLIYAYAETINGVETLLHVRIQEVVTEMGEWTEKYITQIKVLEPGWVRLYRKAESKAKKDEWVLYDEWQTGLSYIPLVTFYADRKDFMVGKPPLLDLAHMNVAHWQSSSDQRSVLTVARFPMLAASGLDPEDSTNKVTVGPYQLLVTPDPQGKFYYVEHTGAAIDAGQKDLEALEEKMGSYGSQFLRKKPGNETATARALDSAEAMSDLQAMAVTFEDAVAVALGMTADWMKITDAAGTVEVNKEFSVEELDAKGLDALDKARQRKDISRHRYLLELVRRGVLDEEFDEDDDKTYLEEELAEAMERGAAMLDLDPAQQDSPPSSGSSNDGGEDDEGGDNPPQE